MKTEKAFTLIELIIATSILAFLMSVIYFIFWKGLSIWEKGNARTQMYQNARVCLDTIAREIRTSFINSSNPCLIFKGDKHSLYYTSTSNKADKKGEYDLCEIGYRLKGSKLQRRIKTILNSASGTGGSTATIASPVLGLDFQYYDGSEWKESWDSTMGTPEDTGDDSLPLAVKITLVTQDERGEGTPLTLSTIAYLPKRE
jgi:type II secretion system protein J